MAKRLAYTDMHTAGEPVRIVTGGYPELQGATILDKRRDARDNHDELRRALMLEPRGHEGMYGVIPVAPTHPDAVLGVLFTHNEGYSTMCGHATIALGRWIVDRGLVPLAEPFTQFVMEAPCGPLKLSCTVHQGQVEAVAFESVPAFAEALDVAVTLPDYGRIICDIAYGGAYYAILPSSRFGLDFFATPVAKLVEAAGALSDHLRASHPLRHPDAPDLGFLYGTILTDDSTGAHDTANLCVFAERQIDRSPTGSGVTARMALDHARGRIAAGTTRRFFGISGHAFTGSVTGTEAAGGKPAVRVTVGGQGFYMGKGQMILEAEDPLRHGFALPAHFPR
ncbi:MAG: proline racemase family protein, partial [Beijerinckiaceae bacterium]